jgi:uncharacterized tellurite resistance protein B-like protein
MGIIAALLGAMAAVGVLLWRIQIASEAARNATEAVGEAQGLFRRLMWWRKASRNQLELVTDPREAAAAMLVAIAQYDGALTADEEALIKDEMRQAFEANEKETEELFVRGRWLTRDAGVDPAQTLRRLAPAVEKALAEEERRELLTMLRMAAGLGSASTSVPHRAIDDLERRLLPRD